MTNRNNNSIGKDQVATHSIGAESLVETCLSDINCLARSHNRLQILKQLHQNPCSSTELRRTLDMHRTTLQRNLRTMREKHWIHTEPTENTHRITPPGTLLLEGFQDVLGTAETAMALGSFLKQFPASLPANIDCLRECRVTTSTSFDPHAQVRRLLTLLEDTKMVRLFVPKLSPLLVRPIADHLTNETTFELISTIRVIERLQNMHPTLIETFVENNAIHFLDTATSQPVGIGILDEHVVLIVYDKKQTIHAILEATSEQQEIIDWAKQRYSSYEQAADPASSHESNH